MIEKQLKMCVQHRPQCCDHWNMSFRHLIDRCYHREMCDFFTLSTKITLNVTPFHCWRFEWCWTVHAKHATTHHALHLTLDWQTWAHMMTLNCKQVRNKINCVKFLRLLWIERCGPNLCKDLLESDNDPKNVGGGKDDMQQISIASIKPVTPLNITYIVIH